MFFFYSSIFLYYDLYYLVTCRFCNGSTLIYFDLRLLKGEILQLILKWYYFDVEVASFEPFLTVKVSEKMPVYKIWDAKRDNKKAVVAGSLAELIKKGK